MSTPTETTERQSEAADPIRVVMIDDDPSEHVLMLAAAREVEVEPDFTFFEDGAHALLHLSGTPPEDLPDVILLDLRMPGLDGHSTLDELQADPLLWQVPVVVFTSSPREADVTTAIDRGAVSYVVKPSDFESMVHNVSDLCDLARRGVSPLRTDGTTNGREERRAGVEHIGLLIEDYLDQLERERNAGAELDR